MKIILIVQRKAYRASYAIKKLRNQYGGWNKTNGLSPTLSINWQYKQFSQIFQFLIFFFKTE